mgnify:CR=1 FL=1
MCSSDHWRDYQEYGWRTYGHGSCGEWFDKAFDHPDVNKRGEIYYNENLKHFFTKTEQTFQYIKNIIGGDYTFNDHLRAINSDYGNNYWFNDYKTCVEQIVKTQYQECIDIKNAVDMFNSTLKNKKNEKDKTLKKINDFVEKNYDTTKTIIKEYESNRLYDFDNIDNSYYNNVKMISDFLILPDRLVITLSKNYNNDVGDIINTTDVDTDIDDSYIAIYNGIENDTDIVLNKSKHINKSNYIRDFKKTVSYGSNKNCIEYSIPFTEFTDNDLLKYENSNIKIVFRIKNRNSTKNKIFAISKSISMINNNVKFNSKNAYLTYLNFSEKNKLLKPKAKEVIDYVQSFKKIKEIIDIEKIYKNLYSIEIPNKITQSLNRYETLYDRYIDETTNDNYSSDKWNSLIESIYVDGIKTKLEKQLKNTISNNVLWETYIKSYNDYFLKYSLLYEIVKGQIDKQIKLGHIRPREGVDLIDFYERSLSKFDYGNKSFAK